MNDYLAHHGIKGQKWGIRRFQNVDGSLTPAGKERLMYRNRTINAGKTKRDVDNIIGTMSKSDKAKLLVGDDGYLTFEQGSSVAKRILEKHGNIPVAFFDVLDDGDTFNLAMGTRSGDAYRGKGYASKAAKRGVDWINKNYTKYGKKKAIWGVLVENKASIRIAEKNGFVIDKDSYSDDGKWVNYEKVFKHSLEGAMYEDYLAHHGILGQKWGHRNGPPYPLDKSDYSAKEKKLNGSEGSGKESAIDRFNKNRQQKKLAKEIGRAYRKNGLQANLTDSAVKLRNNSNAYKQYVDASRAVDRYEGELLTKLSVKKDVDEIEVFDEASRILSKDKTYKQLLTDRTDTSDAWREESNKIAKEALGKYGDKKLDVEFAGRKFNTTMSDYLAYALVNAKERKNIKHSSEDDYLAHHGILGMKWGIRRFQNTDGSLTSEGRERYGSGAAKLLSKVNPAAAMARHKAKREEVKKAKAEAAAAKKAKAEEAAKKAAEEEAAHHEENKQKALQSGSAKDIYKYKGELTAAEIQQAMNRLDWEAKLKERVDKDNQQEKERAEKAADLIKKYGGYANTAAEGIEGGIKAYNAVAKVFNSLGGTDWPIINDKSAAAKAQERENLKQKILQNKNLQLQGEKLKAEAEQAGFKSSQERERSSQEVEKTNQEKERTKQAQSETARKEASDRTERFKKAQEFYGEYKKSKQEYDEDLRKQQAKQEEDIKKQTHRDRWEYNTNEPLALPDKKRDKRINRGKR